MNSIVTLYALYFWAIICSNELFAPWKCSQLEFAQCHLSPSTMAIKVVGYGCNCKLCNALQFFVFQHYEPFQQNSGRFWNTKRIRFSEIFHYFTGKQRFQTCTRSDRGRINAFLNRVVTISFQYTLGMNCLIQHATDILDEHQFLYICTILSNSTTGAAMDECNR